AEKPAFYYAEQSQQTRFTCDTCGGWNDILGRLGYCSSGGTRNDLSHLEEVVAETRTKIHGTSAADLTSYVRELVSAFDTMAQQYANELTKNVPLTPGRRARFENRFHDLRRCAEDFRVAFDINVLEGLDNDAVNFAAMMFERRHVYEHKGGEA